MKYIRPFDPWKSPLCTCRNKYSFNPYTGCAHGCLYCYATYIPHFYELRTKKNLLKQLEKDLRDLPPNALVSMSNSSDPYPPVEKEKEITRGCIKLMREYDISLLVVTKSDIVVRDLDILSEMKCAVSITITGCDPLEPNAPSTERRIKALREVKDWGIPTILRFDPIVPGFNEDKLWIIEKCNADHVVTSTLKLKRDSFRRITGRFPELQDFLRDLYFVRGEKVGGYFYLPRSLRIKMLRRVEEFAHSLGVSCAFCREGFTFEAPSCDGSHLIMKKDIYHSKSS